MSRHALAIDTRTNRIVRDVRSLGEWHCNRRQERSKAAANPSSNTQPSDCGQNPEVCRTGDGRPAFGDRRSSRDSVKAHAIQRRLTSGSRLLGKSKPSQKLRDLRRSEVDSYALSMPKLEATRTKTVQPEFAHLLHFSGFSRVLLYRVSARIAVITQPSTKSVQEVLSQTSGVVDERGEGPARQQPGAQQSHLSNYYYSGVGEVRTNYVPGLQAADGLPGSQGPLWHLEF